MRKCGIGNFLNIIDEQSIRFRFVLLELFLLCSLCIQIIYESDIRLPNRIFISKIHKEFLLQETDERTEARTYWDCQYHETCQSCLSAFRMSCTHLSISTQSMAQWAEFYESKTTLANLCLPWIEFSVQTYTCGLTITNATYCLLLPRTNV